MFHAWRSFSFVENIETIDAYVTCIRQVAALLGYGEPQILEVFKNILPTKLYCILFPIEDLRQAVETAKRILTKEKIDKQLLGQSSSTPFMSIKDSHSRRVSLDTKEELGDKIGKLAVMIGKLATRDSRSVRQFKTTNLPRQRLRDKREVTMRDTIIISEVIRMDIGQTVKTGDSIDRNEVGLGMNKIIGEVNFRDNARNFDRQNRRGEYRSNYRNKGYGRNRSRNGSRESSFSRNFSGDRNRSTSNSRSRSGSRASTN